MSARHVAAAKELGTRRFSTVVALPSQTVTTVVMNPATLTLSVGATRQFTVQCFDQYGVELLGQTFAWSSTNVAIATVTSAGLVTAVAQGSVAIAVVSAGVSDTCPLTVTAAGSYSALNAPSTVKYVPRPHPWTWANPPEFPPVNCSSTRRSAAT